MKLKVKAYAKINLTLDVLDKRSDGYHNVKMVMQTIDLADRLIFSTSQSGITITVDNPDLPTGKDNLVYQAVELLFTEFGITDGVKVEIEKNIPVAAGLAGGSTDAAAALWAVNKLWNLGLSSEELMARGAKLGADIPFCIVGGTKLATGIGTEINSIPQVPKLNLVVVNPPYELSTPEVYSRLSEFTKKPGTDRLLSLLETNKEEKIIANLKNDLETPAVDLYPELGQLKELVADFTDKAVVSGSGPTVLGFVKNQETAQRTADKLQEELTANHKIKPVQTTKFGLESKIISS